MFELVYHPSIFPTVNGSIAHAKMLGQFITGPTLFLGLVLSAGEAGVGNPGSYGGVNTDESMYGSNERGTGNTHSDDGASGGFTYEIIGGRVVISIEAKPSRGDYEGFVYDALRGTRDDFLDPEHWWNDPDHWSQRSADIGQLTVLSVQVIGSAARTAIDAILSSKVNLEPMMLDIQYFENINPFSTTPAEACESF